MVDDLTRPLLGSGNRRRKGPRPAVLLALGLVVVVVSAAIWLLVSARSNDDPEMGEVAAANTIAAPGEVIIRVPDELDESGVIITTPGGFDVDGNGPVIRSLAGGATVSLSPTPESGLLETGPFGLLPRVGDDGRRPFDAYSRPPDAIGGQPVLVAIIVGGIGINQASTELALERLPGEISLALAPYGSNLAVWAARSREAGHEILLQVPLEPYDFPATDPGPHTLLVDDPVQENVDRLEWLLAQFTTYAGVVSYAGGRFLAEEGAMSPLIDALAARGLMFIDDGAAVQSRSGDFAAGLLPFARADLVLDLDVTAAAIAAKLSQLEAMAQQRGFAIATASAFPVTIEQIAIWAETAAERGVILVPVTSLANDPINDAVTIEL